MSNYKTTYISASVHLAGDNPIVNECSTTITICDEAAGAFISLTDSEGATIKLDPDELEIVCDVGRKMLREFDGKSSYDGGKETLRPATPFEATCDLLAVIHRDGGQHTGEVGTVQSCKDAEAVVQKLLYKTEDQSKPSEWTSTKPTNGGVYWVQLDRGLAPETVEVYRIDDDDVWRMRVVGTQTGIIASTIASCLVGSLKNALWNGPLSAPALPDNEAEKA